MQAVLAQPLGDLGRRNVAAVGEEHEPAARRADALEHLDGAGLRPAAAVGAAVQQRAVDVEHEGARLRETPAAAVSHGATPPARSSVRTSTLVSDGRRSSSPSSVTSGARPGRAAGRGPRGRPSAASRAATMASTCSAGIVRRSSRSSSEIRWPNFSRAPSRVIGLSVLELGRLRPGQDLVGDRRVDGRRRLAVVAQEEAHGLVGDVGPALAVDDVARRLAGDELRDGSDDDRVAHLGADPGHLFQHLIEQLGPAQLGEHPPRRGDHAARELVAVVGGVELARRAGRQALGGGDLGEVVSHPLLGFEVERVGVTRPPRGCGPC